MTLDGWEALVEGIKETKYREGSADGERTASTFGATTVMYETRVALGVNDGSIVERSANLVRIASMATQDTRRLMCALGTARTGKFGMGYKGRTAIW